TPKILFLDEPTLGLDPQSRNQLWTHVKNLNQQEGVTVFLTTHYMDEADRVAQRIAVIDHGNSLCDAVGFIHVVGGEKHRDAFLLVQILYVRPELIAALWIESQCRLIEK